jgi:polysaccharide biosynthesis transport protein
VSPTDARPVEIDPARKPNGNGMELSVMLSPLRKWWWLLVAATALAALSSYWYVQRQPAVYHASTTLMIGRVFEDPNPSGNELVLGQQLAGTYADLAQRQLVREKTMAALGLAALPEYSARPLPNVQLLEITVVDTDPDRAQAVANELANQLILQSPTAPGPEEQARQEFIKQQLASLQTNIQETEVEIAAKQAELEAAFGALEIADLQEHLSALQDKLNVLQSNYAALLANSIDGASNTIRVIEPAALPQAPSASGRLQTVLVATALALALAAGTAYLLAYLDDTVRTVDDLGDFNGFTRLPSIPTFNGNGKVEPVIGQGDQRSPLADAFRALRTGLYAATAQTAGKTILITSAVPKEGKSIVAANLAQVLAQGDKSVLLIDADLHRSRQHDLFDVSGEKGLAELLVDLDGHGPQSGELLIKRAVQRPGPVRLSLLAAGSQADEATGLLGSDTMRLLLRIVQQQFDYIIIDSPPVLAIADALTLSIQVDAVVVVARAGSLPRRQLDQTLRRLMDVNANVVGVVLNQQRVRPSNYPGYYYGPPTHKN